MPCILIIVSFIQHKRQYLSFILSAMHLGDYFNLHYQVSISLIMLLRCCTVGLVMILLFTWCLIQYMSLSLMIAMYLVTMDGVCCVWCDVNVCCTPISWNIVNIPQLSHLQCVRLHKCAFPVKYMELIDRCRLLIPNNILLINILKHLVWWISFGWWARQTI